MISTTSARNCLVSRLSRRAVVCSALPQVRNAFASAKMYSLDGGPATQDDPTLFSYTSGRWLYNERGRLNERLLKFDVHALKSAAAAAVGFTAEDVTSLTKISEGGFNRIFRITLKNGMQVIARLSYPFTQPRVYAIASEVATMDFLRYHGLPIPRIFAYNTDGSNPVGFEYMIMEQVTGQPLATIWFDLSDEQRIKLLTEVVKNEVKLFELQLPANGSIFYSKDLPQEMEQIHLLGRFCIGPDVAMENWFEQRSGLNFHRRPSATAIEVLRQAGDKEVAFMKQFGKPRWPFERVYRAITKFAKSNPSDHLQNLQLFLRTVPYLVPTEQWLNKPTIRHPDLNPNNIFISGPNLQITGIIDWQHASILPFFLQAGIPKHFSNYGDPESEALVKPQPPSMEDLDEEERRKDLELYRKRHLHYYYVGATINMAVQHYEAMTQNGILFRQRLFRDVRAPWEGNNVPLQADLVRLMKNWQELIPDSTNSLSPPCPITFSQEDADWTLQAIEKQLEADEQIRIVRELGVGCGADGWVSHEEYDNAMQVVASMKKSAIEQADDDEELQEITKAWPFDDYDETA